MQENVMSNATGLLFPIICWQHAEWQYCICSIAKIVNIKWMLTPCMGVPESIISFMYAWLIWKWFLCPPRHCTFQNELIFPLYMLLQFNGHYENSAAMFVTARRGRFGGGVSYGSAGYLANVLTDTVDQIWVNGSSLLGEFHKHTPKPRYRPS